MTKTAPKALILSAGKGSRLLPHTADLPKCLLDCAGRTLLDWQLDALAAAGVAEALVVTGFRSDLVDATVAARAGRGPSVATLFNPFYHVSENVGSVWMAREWLDRDFLILNGDTLIGPGIADRLLAAAAPITVTIDEKDAYDADDMKVARDGDRLVRIGKTLAECDAESIGFLSFRGTGARTFVDAVDTMMHGREGTASWYLKVIDGLAGSGIVSTVSIRGMEWQEVDYPADYEAARALTARWTGRSRP